MKRKLIIIATVVFFLLVNTSYWWERKSGLWAFPLSGLLVLWFVVLGFILVTYAWKSAEERLADKQRSWITIMLAAVLGLTLLFPAGMIDYEMFRSKVVLRAFREGVANCGTTLTLREDKSFNVTEVCFGFTETTGQYRISNDSIYLKCSPGGEHSYQLALVKDGYLMMYGDQLKDGLPMKINYSGTLAAGN